MFSAVFFALLFGTVVIIHRTPRRLKQAIKDWSPFILRILAMSMSWCLQSTSAWGMHFIFAPIDNVTVQLVHVINAFVVSVTSIVIILGLDRIADKIQEKDSKKKARRKASSWDLHTDHTKDQLHPAVHHEKSHSVLDELAGEHTSGLEAGEHDAELRLDGTGIAEVAGAPLKPEELAKVLRVIILSFGLLVALSWDKAFDAAEETIVHGIGSHFVISKVFLACALVIFVTPAWMWYIVPKAQKSEEQHAHDVANELTDDGANESDSGDETTVECSQE